jgi:hypothetical protein
LNTAGIDVWLDILRVNVLNQQPELPNMFDANLGETKFGRAYFEPNLQILGGSNSIPEVGLASSYC